jgi:hypothetical protein
MTKIPKPAKAPDDVMSVLDSMTNSNWGWLALGIIVGAVIGGVSVLILSNVSISWTGAA